VPTISRSLVMVGTLRFAHPTVLRYLRKPSTYVPNNFRQASRASRHPSSPWQARAGVNLPSWEDTTVRHRLALADRAGQQERIRRAKTLRIPRFILQAVLIRQSESVGWAKER
jgi:hypothetical protein